MPIDPALALNATAPAAHASWDADDVILYHLGIGAGIDKATDPAKLEYTYDRNLKVLPSFGVIRVCALLRGGVRRRDDRDFDGGRGDRIVPTAATKERGTSVLSNAAAWLH